MKRAWISCMVACGALVLGGLSRADVTAGYDFYTDATQDTDGDSVWEDLTAGNPSGLELLVSDAPAVNRISVTSSTRIRHAYDLPGGSTGNVAGVSVVFAGTTNPASFHNTPTDWSTNALSLEVWFRPDVIDPTPTNGYLLFEDGGGSGLGLYIVSNKLVCSQDFDETRISYDLATDPSGVLLGGATSEFMQALVVRDNETPYLTELYINAVSVGSTNDDDGEWTGGDDAAFGTRGGLNAGGRGSGQMGTESFDGQIALIRLYNDQLLTAHEITNNFQSVLDPDITGPVLSVTAPQDDASSASTSDDLIATFDEAIQLVPGGTVTIRNLGTASNEVITIPSAQLSTNGATLAIDPAVDLDYETPYAVQISASALTDVYTNYFAGIADDTTWNFSTVPPGETVVWDGAASGDAIWTEPDSNSWSGGTYDSVDSVRFLGSGAGTVTVDAGGVSPASVEINSSAAYTFSGGSIGGTCTVTKAGSGTLILSSANAFSGGMNIAGGTVQVNSSVDPDCFGDPANVLIFSGNATLHNSAGSFTMAQGIHVNGGVAAKITGAFGEKTYVNGPVTGSGSLTLDGASSGYVVQLKNTANTFTGPLSLYGGAGPISVQVGSLADSSNELVLGQPGAGDSCGQLTFAGATGPMILTNRTLIIDGNGDAAVSRQTLLANGNGNSAYIIELHADLQVNSTVDKALRLGGGNTGDNLIAGDIPDAGGSGKLSIYKESSGKWILAGNNTYEGTTTVTSGTLVLQGEQAILDTGTLNITSGKVQVDTREKIGVLQFSGTPQPSGTYGSIASGAQYTDDARFAGTERLYVGVDFPPSGSVIICR